MNARETLLGAKARTEQVYIKALDYTFTLKGMSGSDRDRFELSCIKQVGRRQEYSADNVRAKLVAFCCVHRRRSRAARSVSR
jgi:hypothetical protein